MKVKGREGGCTRRKSPPWLIRYRPFRLAAQNGREDPELQPNPILTRSVNENVWACHGCTYPVTSGTLICKSVNRPYMFVIFMRLQGTNKRKTNKNKTKHISGGKSPNGSSWFLITCFSEWPTYPTEIKTKIVFVILYNSRWKKKDKAFCLFIPNCLLHVVFRHSYILCVKAFC